MAKIPSQLSPEKAAFIAALASFTDEQIAAFMGGGVAQPALANQVTASAKTYTPFLDGDPANVFVLPDLHCPFMREDFLDWALVQMRKFNCGTTVAIGDILDGCSWNFHEKDPDGMSVGAELEATREQLASVFSAFPTAFCCLGNHDLLVARKMKAIGLSEKFMKPFGEIFDAPPTWEFGHSIEHFGVMYTHGGPGGKADRVAQHSRQSTVQGHYHTESYVHHYVSERDKIFGMQVGAAQNDKAYAFAYGRPFPRKSAIGCGVVLDKGQTPISLLMPL